ARAAGSEYHRDKAIELFRNFVAYNTTPGAMPPKFTDERPLQGMGFRMMTIVTAQELRASIAYEEADARIESAIDTIRAHFVKPDLRVVMESVGPQGEIVDHFGGRMLNPGHAIEAAWFILREAKHRDGDRELLRLGLDMLDWMWARGWDEEYGGILYFRDLKHLPVQEYWHDMKFWWPQCETIIATLMAYRLTGDEKYARWHARIHDWTHARFPDPEYGEWFGYLHRDGRLSVPLKGNLWKGPFHIPRMQLVCWRLTDELAAHSAGLPNSFARSGAQ
ncbi:MAG: AGE family epimerase/isomerase, partial [Kiritimatiellaeota bacterium]|nr:AGE family epimerase/isomerase [Kiritimatiellota bacterium]